MAEAMHWVSRVTVIGLVVVVLTVAGEWADDRFGTTFLHPTGLILGLAAGGYHLYSIAQESAAKNQKPPSGGPTKTSSQNKTPQD